MKILNYSHPLTGNQKQKIEKITGQEIENVYETLPHFDRSLSLSAQLVEVVANTPLSSAEWQTASILVNPPGLASATAALLAILHGRMGYFPATIFIRPVKDTVPVKYEVAEIMNLQALRENARSLRTQSSE